MATLAILLPETIWRLTEIKLELLCQVAPAVFLGVNFSRFGYKEILWGFAAGSIVALVIMFLSYIDSSFSGKPLGFHAGLWGLVVNMIIVSVYNKMLAVNIKNM
jgi:Na+/proline symporter